MAVSKVCGLILAAGRGVRFGADKLRAPFKGRPLAGWVLEAALASGLERVVLVTRPGLALALEAEDPRLRVVLNPAPELGQSLSIKLGLTCLEQGFSHALFLLADQPLIDAKLINKFRQLARDGLDLAALSEGGLLSPPALFGSRYFAELSELEGDQGGRCLLKKYAGKVYGVAPLRPGQGADVDLPGDLKVLEDIAARASGFCACLGLEPGELVSLVGAGGKTSLMAALASELGQAGAKILCGTSTRIYRPQGPLLLAAGEERLLQEVGDTLAPGRPLTIGAGLEPAGERQKVVGLPPQILDRLWRASLADYLLVEADGAKGLPLKAPREHEPVIPEATTLVIGVLGLGTLGRPAGRDTVFALDEFCALTGAEPGKVITPQHLAALIQHPQGLFKGAPSGARRVVFLNQADLPGTPESAREVQGLLQEQTSGPRLVLASLKGGYCEVLQRN